MTVFILDEKPGREWSRITPGAKAVTVVDDEVRTNVARGDVVIFHHEDGPLDTQAKALGKQGTFVIGVNEAGGRGEEISEGYYERRRGVDSPIDPHFRTCFQQFLHRLEETGCPDWALLEGPPPPDALLAHYLLGLLPHDAEAVAARNGLIGAALEEGRIIAEANGRAAPTDADIRDRQFLRELLKR